MYCVRIVRRTLETTCVSFSIFAFIAVIFIYDNEEARAGYCTIYRLLYHLHKSHLTDLEQSHKHLPDHIQSVNKLEQWSNEWKTKLLQSPLLA